jgi:hypothetical protein
VLGRGCALARSEVLGRGCGLARSCVVGRCCAVLRSRLVWLAVEERLGWVRALERWLVCRLLRVLLRDRE